jgi:hypothetical protein
MSNFILAEENAASKKQCDINADMLFFNIVVIIHKEFVPPGQTIIVKVYCDIFRVAWGEHEVEAARQVAHERLGAPS